MGGVPDIREKAKRTQGPGREKLGLRQPNGTATQGWAQKYERNEEKEEVGENQRGYGQKRGDSEFTGVETGGGGSPRVKDMGSRAQGNVEQGRAV